MCVLPQLTQTRLVKQIESAATVLLSPHHRSLLTPTELAHSRNVPRSTIYNIIEQGSRLAEQILDSVDYHFPLDAIEFDELFHANSPIIAALEPYSMSLVLLHQFGDCKASTWKFGFEFLETELPPLMVHDCSMQGNAVVRQLRKSSQLCVWHRVREIWRELRVPFEALQKQALELEDEALWERTIRLEESYATLIALTQSLDPIRLSLRR